MIGELRPDGIASVVPHRPVDAIDGQECQRIRADEAPHAFHVVVGGQKLFALGRIDPVIIRMSDRRRCNTEMYFLCAGVSHHLDDFDRCRSAHDRIVDQDDALARYDGPVRRVFQAHAELANCLGRLDERAPDVVVADDPELIRNA